MDLHWYGTLRRESNENITQVGVRPMGGTVEPNGKIYERWV